MSDKFLEQVADYYVQRPGDLADVTFVMPNKRSGMFLKRYIQQRITAKVAFMPRFTTFGRLAAISSNLREAPRYDKLFTLYNTYLKVLSDNGQHEQAKDFDKFIFWGDMILDDFDEIDRSLANPAKLYKNLKDLRSITADYLTDEQKEVVRNIWGETSMTHSIDRFWLHTNSVNDSSATHRFIALWEILGQIYTEFHKELELRKMATPGMQMRRAVEVFKKKSIEELSHHKYVFVSHSDLSTAECTIMDRLKTAKAAEFFWDTAHLLYFNNKQTSTSHNKALSIIQQLAKSYPMPEDFELCHIEQRGEIDIIGVPSAVAQAKTVGDIIRKLHLNGELSHDNAINTAIIVPDTSLLMPLLLSMPTELSGVNVTMALPYSSTTFATFFRVIISMQRRAKKRRGRWMFFYQDILEVLIHPYLQLINPDDSETIRLKIQNERLYNIDAENLSDKYPTLKFIFAPIDDQNNLEQVVAYINGLLNGIKSSLLLKLDNGIIKDSFEISIIDNFITQVDELYDQIKCHDIEMQESTFFMMFERILASAMLTLSGTPLKGLQAMGVLETRSLDFDNIIIMSMNERTFPRHNYVRTMIPNSLRYGYGLPSIEQSESFYSYYFYRAIARAKHASLLYDSRPANRGGGEMSRYLTQLLYLQENNNVRHFYVDTLGEQPTSRQITVNKTTEVLAELEEFKHLGRARISASALKTYMRCPLAFYLEYVKGLREEDEPTEYLSSAALGTIYHNTMRWLYEPYTNQLITADTIDEMLRGPRMRQILMRELAKVAYNKDEPIPEDQLSAEDILITTITEQQIRFMLDAEKRCYCNGDSFTYIAGEKDIKDILWQVTPELKINFRMQIDRIDQLSDGHLRFIDYKTGSDKIDCGKSIDNLFNRDHSRHAIFQLLLYAEAYNDMVHSGIKIKPALHVLKTIVTEGYIKPLTFNGKEMPSYPEISKLFRPKLNELIAKIFDDTTPFSQCEGTDGCKYCKFLQMCGKNLPEKKF